MDATSRLDIPSISFPRIERLSSSSSSSSMEPRFVRNIFEKLAQPSRKGEEREPRSKTWRRTPASLSLSTYPDHPQPTRPLFSRLENILPLHSSL